MLDAPSPSPAVVTVNACKLGGSGLQRQSKLPPRHRPQGYEEGFDADTLWYDAVQKGHKLYLICPKLNNLASKVRSARWWIDERQVVVQRIRFYRFHDVVELQLPIHMQARRVTIEIGSWRGSASVAQPQPQFFAGLNTVVVMNKNNSLRWITDFLGFYIHHHELEGMIIMDNDSTSYDLQDLEDTISQTGLRYYLIISAPFKFGPYFPQLEKPYLLFDDIIFHAEKYLQTALLNSIQLRYLSRARAVLNCDIDELAYTPKTKIFDLAVRSPLGLVSLPVLWRYSNPMDPDPTRHAAHRLKHLALAEPCHAKWCIDPSGLINRFPLSWNLHWLELEQHQKSIVLTFLSYRVSHALNYIFKRVSLLLCRHGKFWHCRSTTTGWKSGRKSSPPITWLTPDPECEATLNAVFGSPGSPVSP
ncbi:MAG: hypothetical protein OXE74_00070 [Cyanobacteria bacterium MAG CAR2_bin_4]|nr:hypothetical protein [Cyanobacteria bacterium MAG CAR2_bin_4]